jgi:hypothetical protein
MKKSVKRLLHPSFQREDERLTSYLRRWKPNCALVKELASVPHLFPRLVTPRSGKPDIMEN